MAYAVKTFALFGVVLFEILHFGSSHTWNVSSTVDSITVTWSYDPCTSGCSYKVTLFKPGSESETKTGNMAHSTRQETFSSLQTETRYTVEVNVTVGNSTTQLFRNVTATSPYKIASLVRPSATTSSIYITWTNHIESSVTTYLIKVYNSTSNGVLIKDIPNIAQNNFNITGLTSGDSFNVVIYAWRYQQFSEPTSRMFTTVPPPPQGVKVDARDSYILRVTWSPPFLSEGVQSSYKVMYTNSTGSAFHPSCPENATKFFCEIMPSDSHLPGERYEVQVRTTIQGVDSAAAVQSGNTKPLPVQAQFVMFTMFTTTSVKVSWTKPAGTAFNEYKLVLTRDGSVPIENTVDNTTTHSDITMPISVVGQAYNISLSTVSGSEESPPAKRSFNFNPSKPSFGSVTPETDVGTNFIVLNIQKPVHGVFDMYILSVTNSVNNLGEVFNAQLEADTMSYNWSASAEAGTVYNFTLRTRSGEQLSEPHTQEFSTRPNPVTFTPNPTVSLNSAVIYWTPPVGRFHNYKVELITNEFTVKDEVVTKETVSYPSLKTGTVYTVTVKAVTKSLSSEPSSIDIRTTPAAPATLVAGEITNTSIAVSWTPPSSDGTFDTYRLSIDSETLLSLPRHVSAHVFEKLTPATNYTVRLNTISGDKSSSVLSRVFVTLPNPPPDLSITNVSEHSFIVTWGQPSSTYTDHLVHVQYSSDGTLETYTIPLTTGTYSKTVTGRKSGGHYIINVWSRYYQMKSLPVSAAVTTPPYLPWNIFIEHVGKTSIDFRWAVVPDVDFDRFDITVSKYSTGEIILNATALSMERKKTVQGLEPGQIYKIDVYVVSRGVRSLQPRYYYATTLPNSVSSLEKGEVNATSIQVTWTEPVGSVFDSYELSIDPVEQNVVSPVTINRSQSLLQHTFFPLKPGRTYTLNISTVTSSGAKSNPHSRNITAKPRVVENLAVRATLETEIKVTWTVNEDSLQDNFKITYSKNNDASQEHVEQFNSGTYEYESFLTKLVPGHTYTIFVAAISSGEANVAPSVSAVTPPRPVKPIIVSDIKSTSANLKWETEDDSKQDKYQVRYKSVLRNASASWIEKESSAKYVELAGLFPGEHYKAEVSAVSGGVKGQATSQSFTTLPLAPALTVETTSSQSLTIKWTYVKESTIVRNWVVRHRVTGSETWTEAVVEANDVQSEYQKVLTPLVSGQNYSVEVESRTKGNVSSLAAADKGTVRPVCNSVLTEDSVGTTNDTVVVHYTSSTVGVFSHYYFCLYGSSKCVGDVVFRNKDEATTVTFTEGVVAGRLYKVQLFTVSGDQSSEPVELSVRTVPNSVEATVRPESSSQLTIQWSKPAGDVSHYEVNCTGQGCQPSVVVLATGQSMNILRDGLAPFTTYTITVVTISGNKRSPTWRQTVTTKQAVPSAPRDLKVDQVKTTSLRLSWQPPANPNGNLVEYRITYQGIKEGKTPVTGSKRKDHQADPRIVLRQEMDITDLKAGYNYTFTVEAKTIAYGKPASVSEVLPTDAPTLRTDLTPDELKPSVAGVRDSDTHSRTQSLKIKLKQAFTDTNGELIGYTIIVAEVTDANSKPASTTGAFISSYKDVVNQDVWPPYQVIPPCNVFDSSSNCASSRGKVARRRRSTDNNAETEFVIGAVDCSNAAPGEYCNGRLRPGKQYKVMLRGYTDGNHFSDTPYSVIIKTEPDNTGVIVGVVVTILVLLVVGGLLMVWFLRRRGILGNQRMKGSEPDTTLSPTTGIRLSSRKNKRDRSRPVKLNKFAEHLENLAKDGEFGYAEEYEDLRLVGRNQLYIASDIVENRPKNRFTNIFPYDHSRVKLLPIDDVEGSDYINANYIPGYNGKREFIVSQGPMKSTVDDFWRMVWEQNVRVIVMLTLCVEKMKEKCHHYWPEDKELVNYGDISVHIVSETSWGSYNITDFKVIKGEHIRFVRHYHFLKWPDFRHLEPEDILGFVHVVRSDLQMHKSPGPVLVHCSAGVGRSGTFIAIDRCLQHIQEHDYLDIFGIVYEMRMNRVLMVQTERQYVSIHNCLLYVIQGKDSEADVMQGVDNKAFIEDNDGPYENYRTNGAVGDSQVNVQLTGV